MILVIIVAFSRERERERDVALIHIYNNIISFDNLLTAWQEFLRGKRKRKDVAVFSVNLVSNISSLQRDLSSRTYTHGGYESFKINDSKPRDIHKASVRDRLLHHAIYRILYPFFDSKFIFDSYSCRLDKGTHRAIDRFCEYAGKVSKNHMQTVWVLKCDIKKFFANIDHGILKSILRTYFGDEDTLWLLGTAIDSFDTIGKVGVGLPLGNLTSQLFVNIYMNKFDQFVKRKLKAKYYVRYADDFVILDENKEYLESLLAEISGFLKDELNLDLNPKKVSISTFASGVDFLGWINFSHHRVLRNSTKKRIILKWKDGLSDESISSYLGHLSHGNAHKIELGINRYKIADGGR